MIHSASPQFLCRLSLKSGDVRTTRVTIAIIILGRYCIGWPRGSKTTHIRTFKTKNFHFQGKFLSINAKSRQNILSSRRYCPLFYANTRRKKSFSSVENVYSDNFPGKSFQENMELSSEGSLNIQ